MTRKPSPNLLRVRKFRQKAGQARLEILADLTLKQRFRALPGASHTERLRALLDLWDQHQPQVERKSDVAVESTAAYQQLQERIAREFLYKETHHPQRKPERGWRKKWREDPHYRAAAQQLAEHVSLPQLAACIQQGWGPYLLEAELLTAQDAEPEEACHILGILWRQQADLQDLLNPWKDHLPPARCTYLKGRYRQHADAIWRRQNPTP